METTSDRGVGRNARDATRDRDVHVAASAASMFEPLPASTAEGCLVQSISYFLCFVLATVDTCDMVTSLDMTTFTRRDPQLYMSPLRSVILRVSTWFSVSSLVYS